MPKRESKSRHKKHIMSCKIEINYPQPKEEAVQKLKDAILANNGTFNGNTTMGHFKVPTGIGLFEVQYTINGDLIKIDVLKKPLVISCEKIEKEIRQYLEGKSFSVTDNNYLDLIREYKYQDTDEKKYGTEIKSLQMEDKKDTRKLMAKYLKALSHLDAAVGDLPFMVKKAILNVRGNYTTDPDGLPEQLNLKVNLGYNSNDYIMLAFKLNEIIANPAASITMAEMNKCKTVGDCIALTNKKTQIA